MCLEKIKWYSNKNACHWYDLSIVIVCDYIYIYIYIVPQLRWIHEENYS